MNEVNFYIENVGWIPSSMIEEGDIVVFQSGKRAIVEDIDKIVYNGTSENRTVHEFYVDGKKKYIIKHAEDKM
ncbi:hypothetical protein [Terrisporobacter vanillatitrophus]|uniref:hypothetical protein n=1 Tax=Terrisporobacter vanillatitrophus TaxID=3058402 RepID=UPI00336894C3